MRAIRLRSSCFRSCLLAALSGLSAILALGGTGCERPASLVIVNVRTFRDVGGKVVVDADVEAVEQGGGNVGGYCVTMHAMPFGFDAKTGERHRYAGEVDFAGSCASDLEDGDQRTFRLVSTTRLPEGQPIRVQVSVQQRYDTEQVYAPREIVP